MAERTHYRILQVDEEADPEIIDAAYRRLARLYHPDVNKAPDSVRTMQEINAAYEVLSDASRRQAYDARLRASREREEAAQEGRRAAAGQAEQASRTQARSDETPGGKTDASQRANRASSTSQDSSEPGVPFHCQRCGRVDTSLRMAAFPYVISLLVVTYRRAWMGVYCDGCRRHMMFKAKIVILLLGWWGIPFGVIRTIGVLFGSSEGVIPDEANGSYLAALGAHFAGLMRLADVAEAWETSLAYHDSTVVREVYQQVFHRPPARRPRPSHGQGGGFAFGSVSLCAFAVLVLSTNGFGFFPDSRAPVKSASRPVYVVVTPRPTILSPGLVLNPGSAGPTSQPSSAPTRWSLPPVEVYVSVEANFVARIPQGSEVEVREYEESAEGPAYVQVGVFPPATAGLEGVFAVVSAMPLDPDDASRLTEDLSPLRTMAEEWYDDREGWRRIAPVSIWEAGRLNAAESAAEGPLGEEQTQFRSYYRLIAAPTWLYSVEVIGEPGNSERTALWYDGFVSQFMPSS